METIFTYYPSPAEFEEITNNATITDGEYLDLLEQRAKNNDTSINYERVVDLEELFSLRGDEEAQKKYTDIINSQFSEITDRLFNE